MICLPWIAKTKIVQVDRLKPRMTRPSITAPPASKTTAVVFRDWSARVDLCRLLLSCTNVPPPNWASPYHARSLSQSSDRYVESYLWLDLLIRKSHFMRRDEFAR